MDDVESELRQSDGETFAGRLARAREAEIWLDVPAEGYSFGPERESLLAFWDARFCYIDGFWIAAILTSLTAMERHVAWRLSTTQSANVKGMSALDITEAATATGFIDRDQADTLAELRTYRDDYGRLGQDSNYERKLSAEIEGEPELEWGGGFDPNELLSGDARKAVRLATAYFVKWAATWDGP